MKKKENSMIRMAVFGLVSLGLVCQAEASEVIVVDDHRTKGEAYLAENAKREGVVVLRSGLQYEVIVEGNGRSPRRRDKVTTHYHGTFVDGRVFDSSIDRGSPIEFPVGGVIKGWTEALQLMQVGDKWRLFIPPHLAYAERGVSGIISPGTTLVFEVELLKVN